MNVTERTFSRLRTCTRGFSIAMGAGLIVLVLSISVAVSVGAVSIPLSTVWGVVLNKVARGTIPADWS